MELRDLIEQAAKIAGSQIDLAKVIGVTPDALTHAKAGRRGLPEVACGKLAEILGPDRWTVVAASALVTEKNPDKRAYLTPFVRDLPRKVAAWVIASASAATLGTIAPGEAKAYANDTIEVSSPALQPAQTQESKPPFNWHYVHYLGEAVSRIAGLVRSSFAGALPRFGFSGS